MKSGLRAGWLHTLAAKTRAASNVPRGRADRSTPKHGAQENRKTSRRFFFFSRRKWAGGRRILQGGGAAVSPASACGAQASPAARYPTPSGRALGLLLRCRRWRCGQRHMLVPGRVPRVPMHQGCAERRWVGLDRLRRLGGKEEGLAAIPEARTVHAIGNRSAQNSAHAWRLEHWCATS